MADPSPIDQFEAMVLGLIQEAIRYASEGEYSEEAASNIRRVRILCNVLLASAAQADTVPPPPAS